MQTRSLRAIAQNNRYQILLFETLNNGLYGDNGTDQESLDQGSISIDGSYSSRE
jgi:hypothetical protein